MRIFSAIAFTVLVVSVAIGQGLQQQLPPPVRYVVYGSAFGMICNDLADSTAAFNAAKAAMAANGGKLIFPTGTCRVSTITLDKSGIYEGQGITVASGGANSSTIIKGTVAGSPVINITAASGGVKLSGLTVLSSIAVGSRTAPGVNINAGPSVIIDRVNSVGHQDGYVSQSAGVEFNYTNSSGNNRYDYLLDGTVSAQNEIGFYWAKGGGSTGDCVRVNGPATGIFTHRLTCAGAGGAGFTALKVGAGVVNDVYFTAPEFSANTGVNVDFSTNSGGTGLTMDGGLVEGTSVGISLGNGFTRANITGVSIDGGTGILNNAQNVTLTGNITTNSVTAGISLGANSSGAILTGNRNANQGATSAVGLLINASAAAFTAMGNDWSDATTPRSGSIPTGSYYCGNKGDICQLPNTVSFTTGAFSGLTVTAAGGGNDGITIVDSRGSGATVSLLANGNALGQPALFAASGFPLLFGASGRAADLQIGTGGQIGVATFASATANSLCYSTTALSGFNSFATCSSLRALKDDIGPIENPLSIVRSLEPREYWSKTSERREYGLYAEDVEKSAPLLSTYYEGKLRGVDYAHLAAVNSGAIRQLHDIVVEQKAQIDGLIQKVQNSCGGGSPLTWQSCVVQRPTTTVGSLPTCNAGAQGLMYIVTNALVPVALATVAGGGAVVVGVTCNGSAWIVQ